MTDFKNLPANRFIFAINSKQDIYFVFFFGLHFQSWLVFVFVVLEVLFPDLEKLCNLNSFFFGVFLCIITHLLACFQLPWFCDFWNCLPMFIAFSRGRQLRRMRDFSWHVINLQALTLQPLFHSAHKCMCVCFYVGSACKWPWSTACLHVINTFSFVYGVPDPAPSVCAAFKCEFYGFHLRLFTWLPGTCCCP